MQVDEIQDQNIQDQDIKNYLKNNPEFFEQNANTRRNC